MKEPESLEESLVMIKPDGVEKAKEILDRLDSLGCERVIAARFMPVPSEFIRKLYLPHAEKDFYEPYVNYFCGKEVILSIYSGKDVIARLIEVIGSTEPAKAKPGTIRRDFGDPRESYEFAKSQGRPFIYNIIHRSDSPESSKRERGIFRELLSS